MTCPPCTLRSLAFTATILVIIWLASTVQHRQSCSTHSKMQEAFTLYCLCPLASILFPFSQMYETFPAVGHCFHLYSTDAIKLWLCAKYQLRLDFWIEHFQWWCQMFVRWVCVVRTRLFPYATPKSIQTSWLLPWSARCRLSHAKPSGLWGQWWTQTC